MCVCKFTSGGQHNAVAIKEGEQCEDAKRLVQVDGVLMGEQACTNAVASARPAVDFTR